VLIRIVIVEEWFYFFLSLKDKNRTNQRLQKTMLCNSNAGYLKNTNVLAGTATTAKEHVRGLTVE
jgi:hypothetical protein